MSLVLGSASEFLIRVGNCACATTITRVVDRSRMGMKSPPIYGHVSELTPEERFLEIRDLFLWALHRLHAEGKLSQIAHNKLDIESKESVYAFR